jgi:hypothetical protein
LKEKALKTETKNMDQELLNMYSHSPESREMFKDASFAHAPGPA